MSGLSHPVAEKVPIDFCRRYCHEAVRITNIINSQRLPLFGVALLAPDMDAHFWTGGHGQNNIGYGQNNIEHGQNNIKKGHLPYVGSVWKIGGER